MIEQRIAEMEKAAAEQTAASQKVVETVNRMTDEIHSTLNEAIQKSQQLTSASVTQLINTINTNLSLTYHVCPETGSDDNTGLLFAAPARSVTRVLNSIPGGVRAKIKLRRGQTHVIEGEVVFERNFIAFEHWAKEPGDNDRDIPTLTHSCNFYGNRVLKTGCLVPSKNTRIEAKNVRIRTCKWSDWVDGSANKANDYEVALIRGHSQYSMDNVLFTDNCEIELFNSSLTAVHTTGAIGWLGNITLFRTSVKKVDLAADIHHTEHQWLIDWYGNSAAPVDIYFTYVETSGVPITDFIAPEIVLDNVRSNVPLKEGV